jgi:CRISPR-associated protein Cas1
MVIKMKDDPDFIRTIPVEDIGFVLLENQQICITLPLLNALADNNAAVIVCTDKMMPNAMLLNLDSNSVQGERYRDQINASEPLKKNLWKQTVEAKIRNQAALLDKLDKDGSQLKPYWQNVKSGDADNREGIAAKIYWDALFGDDFMRYRSGVSPNEMLNYGYTVLRAAVARSLMGTGLFPAFGIYHRNRYNAFPLADDIMEPYRPYVDEIVFDLYANGEQELNKDVKAELLKFLYVDTVFDKVTRPLDLGLSVTTSSLAKCFSGDQKKILYPLLV